ncbi:head maturation protease, ClpP-related [uncultured Methylobacterium sp.]|uniref:head maturation protease, ClpP-related n=1 Tax=uncultured Methylobacterium sp. TaxID=157278 RepID=UPI0035CAC70A
MLTITNRAGAAAAPGEVRRFWEVKNYATFGQPARAEIALYGDIGEGVYDDYGDPCGITAQAFLREVQALPALEELTIRIMSCGGNSVTAAAIYGIISGMTCRKVGIVDGIAASAATVILMACDEVRMPANAMFMIHDPSVTASGNARQLGEVIESLIGMKATIVAAYASKNRKMSVEEISAAMSAETYYGAAEAVEAGFADTVLEPSRIQNLAALDPAALKGAPEAFVQAVKAQLAEAAAATEDTMKPEEIASSFAAITASLTALTETVKGLGTPAAAVVVEQVENKVVVEKTPAERDAESLAKVKTFAETNNVMAIFNKYVEAGSPVEAVRTAVFGAAATADAAKPVTATKVQNKVDAVGQGLTEGVVGAWYSMINKRA